MLRSAIFAMSLALALAGAPGSALAQSAPMTGPSSATVHGQNWNMRQDLSSAANTQRQPQTRTQHLRQRAAQTETRRRAQQRAHQRRSRR